MLIWIVIVIVIVIVGKFKLCSDAVELRLKLGSCVLSVGAQIVGAWVDFLDVLYFLANLYADIDKRQSDSWYL